jgi:uncharacterized lipoprotein YajG
MTPIPIRGAGTVSARVFSFALCVLLLGCAAGPSNVQVQLAPYAAPPATAATRGVVQVDQVREARRDAVGRQVGQRTGLGGMSMGQIEVTPTPVSITTSLLQAELRGQGFTISDADAPARLSARLTRFEIQTPATALYWDINGSVELEVEAKRLDGRQHATVYQASCTERTYTWPGEELIAKVLGSCLKELGSRIRADGTLAGFLAAA